MPERVIALRLYFREIMAVYGNHEPTRIAEFMLDGRTALLFRCRQAIPGSPLWQMGAISAPSTHIDNIWKSFSHSRGMQVESGQKRSPP